MPLILIHNIATVRLSITVTPIPFAVIPAVVLRDEYYGDECDTRVLVIYSAIYVAMCSYVCTHVLATIYNIIICLCYYI